MNIIHEQNLLGSVDPRDEILIDDDDESNKKVNVNLWLYDEQYEEFINRTDMLKELNMTFNDLLNKTDATVNVCVEFAKDKTTAILSLESEDLGYKTYEFPLTSNEVKDIENAANKILGRHLTNINKIIGKESEHKEVGSRRDDGRFIRVTAGMLLDGCSDDEIKRKVQYRCDVTHQNFDKMLYRVYETANSLDRYEKMKKHNDKEIDR